MASTFPSYDLTNLSGVAFFFSCFQQTKITTFKYYSCTVPRVLHTFNVLVLAALLYLFMALFFTC